MTPPAASSSETGRQLRLARKFACAGLWSLVLGVPAAQSQIQFEDVSEATGMTGFTETWGASWGDLNGDNWPDLFIQGHRDFPRFYRNTGDGSFEDVAYEVDPGNWIAKPMDDKHGAAWADFDNDGDEDLLIGVSATGRAQLLVNDDGTFTERAQDADISSDSTNRHSVWFDYNRDGFLDVAQLYLGGATLRRQDPSDGLDFDDDHSRARFSCPGRLDYGQMLDVNNDGVLEFICAETGVFPFRVFNIATFPFQVVTSSIPLADLVNDTAVADFNGDLRYDIVMTRGAVRPSGAKLVSDTHIEAWLRSSESSSLTKGFSFVAPGQITVTMDHSGMGVREDSRVFVLNTQGPTSVTNGPVTVRYNSTAGRWEVTLGNSNSPQAYIVVDTVATVSDLIVTGLDNSEGPVETLYLENSASGMNYDDGTGLFEPVSCVSAAAGDFDNDMDVDLYLVCRTGVENLANRLYENQGDGSFLPVPQSGAEGPVGVGEAFGVGESVVVADYDVDGLLDLFVANGLLFFPVGDGGPDLLFQNRTNNDNHWIEIDLRGISSNRDGVGAKVYVTAGGVTQLREQNGGYHRWSQDHQRLHFGLAGNQTAAIRIEWPSGAESSFNGVAADQLYDATENGALTQAALGPPLQAQLQSGDECGEPPYHLDYGPAVLLWRDCPGNSWHLRARGGREMEQKLITAGHILGDAAFSSVSGHQLNSSDSLENEPADELHFSVGAWFSNNKGFNFSTSGQGESCFDLTTQDIPALIIGSSKKRVPAPFDLVSLEACPPPPPPTAAPECGDPMYDKSADPGVFAWRDCTYSGPEARWNVRVSAGGQSFAEYAGSVTSSMTIPGTAATGFSIESNDTLDSVPGDSEVDFSLFVGGSGQDGFQLDVPAGSQTCLDVATLPAGRQVHVGADRQVMSGPFNLETLGPCN